MLVYGSVAAKLIWLHRGSNFINFRVQKRGCSLFCRFWGRTYHCHHPKKTRVCKFVTTWKKNLEDDSCFRQLTNSVGARWLRSQQLMMKYATWKAHRSNGTLAHFGDVCCVGRNSTSARVIVEESKLVCSRDSTMKGNDMDWLTFTMKCAFWLTPSWS